MFATFLHGFILAFGLILPLGPQNVFVFNQGALQPNFTKSLPVVLTASLCDTVLISLAILGVSVVILEFSWLQIVLYGIGFFFLLYMGWSIWRASPAKESGHEHTLPAKKQIAFALSVSLLNPHAILDTIGVIGTSAIAYTGNARWAFAIACIAVSWIWFFSLAVAGRVMGSLDTTGKCLVRINKISALVIWGVAVLIAKEFLKAFHLI
ncbi:hypothetical protein BpJC7_09310 [Weizmannia acidilactici]|uniref:Uncharacterized protein n=1 Tax=Weizmannia acidilactici TaxID=2607726 RepID=A0A5J4JGZ4_9BACI|nr:LysE/ArgO family amino acid transporter [Weizmannia acidilactici]GER66974.1 hypothetical protein BpJC4_14450 [Weizmannia acidilactici]GER69628.1 hypothetical protein BpJC7_09310 [Weizmannia acidilactici]GER72695.1 hypothetical protein BpPP18_07620 [Weizmannia acidilactici]